MNRTTAVIVALILCLCMVFGWWLFARKSLVDPLPPLAEVESMSASNIADLGDFQIHSEHWQSLYNSLQPAKRDDSPAKWVYVGQLVVNREKGGVMHVFLYHVDEGAGAFAVSTGKQSVYYRGGNSKQLMEALRSAHSESQ